MKKPVVGIVPLVDAERDSYWMLPGYMEGISQAGGLPVMLPLTEEPSEIRQLAAMCDGLLFTGGQDVSPDLYGEERTELCGECCELRDRMEILLLDEALKADKAVFGICRGLQFLNAALGGTLYQDLPAQYPSDCVHHQPAPYDIPSHQVELTAGSPLRELIGADRMPVNSCHHQGIRKLAPGLEVMAAAEDGLTEAVRLPGKRFVWAVQWHPEFSFRKDGNSRRILKKFVENCNV